ncbi:hypothetical protein BVRB_5g104830 [Beta vulgaris subsp. vulgaris]|nr:hypothetical protein BVRB_5g104830 [Beta vulgaris subsp. vulgaris]
MGDELPFKNSNRFHACILHYPHPASVGRFIVLSFFLQTKLYTEDWIGLKTLDVAGTVKFVSVAGIISESPTRI